MSQKFFPAPEVEKIANKLIPQYHKHLEDFSVKVKYAFCEKTPKSKGREVWGTCRKVTTLNSYLSGEECEPYFVIVISHPVWELLPEEKRIALVDHELCHAMAQMKKDETQEDEDVENFEDPVNLSIKPHDLEEFTCIVKRHGLWKEDIEEFVKEALRTKDSQNKKEEPI
jgi:predicted metallopeptidase